MSILKQSTIKEIARDIAIGHTCYINRRSAKITTIDHSIEDPALVAAQALTIAALEKKIEHHVKIEKLNTEKQLMMMQGFLEELSDKSARKQLANALKRNNPVRNFNQAIENDIELSQYWRNFKAKAYQQWVSDFIIDAYNY